MKTKAKLPYQTNPWNRSLNVGPTEEERWIDSCWCIFFFLILVLSPSGWINVHGAFFYGASLFLWWKKKHKTSKEKKNPSSCSALSISCLKMCELSWTRRNFTWTLYWDQEKLERKRRPSLPVRTHFRKELTYGTMTALYPGRASLHAGGKSSRHYEMSVLSIITCLCVLSDSGGCWWSIAIG